MMQAGFIERLITPRRKHSLMVLTGVVWALAIAGSFYRLELAAKNGVAVHLETQPAQVRILVNGQKYGEGAYITTPTKLLLPPGKSQVRIAREGYVSHSMSVEGEIGEEYKMAGVVLEKRPDAVFQRLAISVQPHGKVIYVEIDDGIMSGEAPMVIDDLLVAKGHLLSFYPEWPDRSHVVRCYLGGIPRKDISEAQSVKVKVKKSGKIAVTGCKQFSSKN